MGTWGVAIFSDDIASDVRDQYREHLGDGEPDSEATRLVREGFVEELADDETAPIVWLALAAAQSRVGRLEDRVRDEAIRVIDAGTDLQRWHDDPRAMAKRQAALARLRDELIGPQRPRRRVPKPIRSVGPWEPGSIVSFRRDDGRHLLLRVKATQGEHGVGGGRFGIFEVLDWIGEEVPERATIERLPFATARDWSATDGHPRLHGVMVLNQRQLDRFSLVVEGSEPSDWQMNFVIDADDLEGLAERRFGLV
jgi:hypothetical protein